jgi:hypothetical protein
MRRIAGLRDVTSASLNRRSPTAARTQGPPSHDANHTRHERAGPEPLPGIKTRETRDAIALGRFALLNIEHAPPNKPRPVDDEASTRHSKLAGQLNTMPTATSLLVTLAALAPASSFVAPSRGRCAAVSVRSEEGGASFQNPVKTVSDTIKLFDAGYTKPIVSLWASPINDMLQTTHISKARAPRRAKGERV